MLLNFFAINEKKHEIYLCSSEPVKLYGRHIHYGKQKPCTKIEVVEKHILTILLFYQQKLCSSILRWLATSVTIAFILKFSLYFYLYY
jgi:hypothetical protein